MAPNPGDALRLSVGVALIVALLYANHCTVASYTADPAPTPPPERAECYVNETAMFAHLDPNAPVLLKFMTRATQYSRFSSEWSGSAELAGWARFYPIGGCDEWHGFRTKIRVLVRVLRIIAAVNASAVVITSDVNDVFLNSGPDAAMAAFASFGRPVVLSAEERCGPNCVPGVALRCGLDARIKRRNINGGFAMGRAGPLLRLHTGILGAYDDQIGFAHLWERDCSAITLDTGGILSRVVYVGEAHLLRRRGDHFVVDDPPVRPVAIHFLFQDLDLGARRATLGKVLVPSYRRTTRMAHFRMLSAHIQKHSANSAYSVVRQIVVSSLALVVAASTVLSLRGRGWRQALGTGMLAVGVVVFCVTLLTVLYPYKNV
jgi:hypothetical protein